jgi:phosphomethylpyrimidine synthase
MEDQKKVLGMGGISREKIKNYISSGRLILVRNPRRDVEPLAIGDGVSTKVNANIGVSPDKKSLKDELKKADIAVEAGADALMDLSVGGDITRIRKKILSHVKVPVGTVPIYQVYADNWLDFTIEDYLKEIECQCREGVDFMTIHAGLLREGADLARKRTIPITSRGGCFLAAWMEKHNRENPLYDGYDLICEILREYDVTISLGDGLRPGCLEDSTDEAQMHELKVLGKLTEKAWKAGVKVMVEGPGHVPMNEIEKNVKLQKKICSGAPFYVLGPLVTDIGVGHDHITSAIGGAIAGSAGADFLCYVTPAEHLRLPDEKDVRNGVIASTISDQTADIFKYGIHKADLEMGKARNRLDWDTMFDLALDPEIKHKEKNLQKGGECSMCGKYCALKIFDNPP